MRKKQKLQTDIRTIISVGAGLARLLAIKNMFRGRGKPRPYAEKIGGAIGHEGNNKGN